MPIFGWSHYPFLPAALAAGFFYFMGEFFNPWIEITGFDQRAFMGAFSIIMVSIRDCGGLWAASFIHPPGVVVGYSYFAI
jgi:hypothetical protein